MRNNQLQWDSQIMKSKAILIKPSRTLRGLYYWGKFVGIFSLTLSRNNKLEFSYPSQFYGCFLAATYGYAIYSVLFERILMLENESPIAPIVDFIGLISVFLENSFAWSIAALCQNRMMFVIEGFARAEDILKKLGITDNYDKHLRKLGIQLTLVNTMYLISIVSNNLAITDLPNFRLILWVCYTVPRIVSLNMATLYLWCLATVEEKFRRLNEKVRSLMRNDCSGASGVAKNFRTGFLADKIKTISQSHRELSEVIHRIENYFGVFIFFTVASHFSNITINVYSMYTVTKISSPDRGMTYVHLFAVSYWAIYPITILAIIANTSASMTREANMTGDILHSMLTDSGHFCDSREAAKFHVLSLNLLHNRVRMTLYGFFELDDFLVYRSIAASTMYLVIILQFYG